jgi:hypothetical protein
MMHAALVLVLYLGFIAGILSRKTIDVTNPAASFRTLDNKLACRNPDVASFHDNLGAALAPSVGWKAAVNPIYPAHDCEQIGKSEPARLLQSSRRR